MKGAPPMGGLENVKGPPIVMQGAAARCLGLALTTRGGTAYTRTPSVSEWRNW